MAALTSYCAALAAFSAALASRSCLAWHGGLLGGLAAGLLLGGLLLEHGGGSVAELVGEALDASTGVDELLLAGEERVALVAQFDVQLAACGRAGLETVPARADDGRLHVVRDGFLASRSYTSDDAPGFRPGLEDSRKRIARAEALRHTRLVPGQRFRVDHAASVRRSRSRGNTHSSGDCREHACYRCAIVILAVAALLVTRGLLLRHAGSTAGSEAQPTPTAATEPTLAPEPTPTPEPTAAPKTAPEPAPKPPADDRSPSASTSPATRRSGWPDETSSSPPTAPRAAAKAAIRALLKGPSARRSRATDLAARFPRAPKLRGAHHQAQGRRPWICRSGSPGGGSLSMQMRAAQVVCTLTQFSGVRSVAFKLDGKRIESLGGEGVMVAPSVDRDDFEDMLPRDPGREPACPVRDVTSPVAPLGIGERLRGAVQRRRLEHGAEGHGHARPDEARSRRRRGARARAGTRVFELKQDGSSTVDTARDEGQP